MVETSFINRYKLLISMIAAFVTTAILIFCLKYVLDLQSRISFQKNELSALQSELNALDKLQEDSLVYRDKIDQIEKSLPSSYGEVSHFVQELENIAGQSGNTINMQIFKDAEDVNNMLSSVIIKMEMTGSYTSHTQILSQLANLPYHTKIDTTKIEGAGSEITSDSQLRMYLWKENIK